MNENVIVRHYINPVLWLKRGKETSQYGIVSCCGTDHKIIFSFRIVLQLRTQGTQPLSDVK